MQLTWGLFGFAVLLGCVGEPGREQDSIADTVARSKQRGDARLRVAFLPTPESCSPQDLIATRALDFTRSATTLQSLLSFRAECLATAGWTDCRFLDMS